MTPALVIGEELLHQGSVPNRQKVSLWIRAHLGTGTSFSQNHHIVEVLGSGCPKCAMLYDNVILALAQTGIHEQVTVRKRTDLAYFQEMGVFITPGLVIDGRVASEGKVMTADRLADLFLKHMSV